MPAYYSKLWKILKIKNMKKKDLIAVTGLSQATVAKLSRNATVSGEVLVKICEALSCDIGDIMEVRRND